MGIKTRLFLATITVATPVVAHFEGRNLLAHLDPVGIPTICEGWTRGVQLGDKATPAPRPGASASGRPVRVRMHVLETMGFDAARIRVTINGRAQKTEAVLTNPGVEISFRVDAGLLKKHGNAVVAHLVGPRSSTFAQVDPATADHRRRSFAVRGMSVELDK